MRVSAPCEARTPRELHRQLRTFLPHAAALSLPSRPARPRPGSGLQTEHRRPAGAAAALMPPAARAAQPMADGTCVIVGDDEALLREAEALAVERLGCALFRGREAYEMSSHMQHTFNRLPYDQRCAASLHLLTDMELLAHTDFFVGACRAAGCGRGAPACSSAACLARRLGSAAHRTDMAACARGMSAAGRALGRRRCCWARAASRLGTRGHGGRRAHLMPCCARCCPPARRSRSGPACMEARG